MEKIRRLLKRFKEDEVIFVLSTAFKIAGIFLFILFLGSYLLWLLVSMNTIFIEANAQIQFQGIQSMYNDYVLSRSLDNIQYVFAFLIILFLGGMYIGLMLLRPFKAIKQYCEKKANGETAEYAPDLFSEYKLLTRFSEFFFQFLNEVERDKEIKKVTIPPLYTKIHSPPFDRVFFFHFALIISIIALTNFIFVSWLISDLQDGILELISNLVKDKDLSVAVFINQQEHIFESLKIFLSLILVIYYLLLSFHLYGKVSGAIFGFFSTMRSFMKGNLDARVHLLGYNHIRSAGRAMNKYIKITCERYSEKKDSK